jgi:heme/copper-type cytochrome/quinol oxidase subunit 2
MPEFNILWLLLAYCVICWIYGFAWAYHKLPEMKEEFEKENPGLPLEFMVLAAVIGTIVFIVIFPVAIFHRLYNYLAWVIRDRWVTFRLRRNLKKIRKHVLVPPNGEEASEKASELAASIDKVLENL